MRRTPTILPYDTVYDDAVLYVTICVLTGVDVDRPGADVLSAAALRAVTDAGIVGTPGARSVRVPVVRIPYERRGFALSGAAFNLLYVERSAIVGAIDEPPVVVARASRTTSSKTYIRDSVAVRADLLDQHTMHVLAETVARFALIASENARSLRSATLATRTGVSAVWEADANAPPKEREAVSFRSQLDACCLLDASVEQLRILLGSAVEDVEPKAQPWSVWESQIPADLSETLRDALRAWIEEQGLLLSPDEATDEATDAAE